MKYCRFCHAQLNDDAIFCDKCGSRLDDESNNKTSFDDGKTVCDKELFKCPSCLSPISSNISSCPYCGYKIKKAKKSKLNKKYVPLIIVLSSIFVTACAIAIPIIVDENYVPKPKEGQTIFVEYSYLHFGGENYKNVEAYFVNKGFENVQLIPINGLINGLIAKNTVDTVSINGNDHFHKKRWHYPTEPIMISYNSF